MSEDLVNPWSKPPRSLLPTRAELIGLIGLAVFIALLAIPTAAPWLVWPSVKIAADRQSADIDNGRYLVAIAGCANCHTAVGQGAEDLAGGRRVATPFGTLVAPNITPDPEAGIGGWSLTDFATALRRGLGPNGRHLYPAFPYTSYGGLADSDVADMKAYLDTVPPSDRKPEEASLPFPFNLRPAVGLWKLAFFDAADAPQRSPEGGIARGRYLAEIVAHCGECHTPRNRLGGFTGGRHFAGTDDSRFNPNVPNITPHADGIGAWSRAALVSYLATGIRPDGKTSGGEMGLVVTEMTARMTEADRGALADYLLQVPPLPSY